MLDLGLCCDTGGTDDFQALADLHQPLVRVALTKAHSDVPQWHRRQGRRVIGVVCAETFDAFGLDRDSYSRCAPLVQQRWGALLDYLEIGNEPDDPGASSFGIPPESFERMVWMFHATFHDGQHDTPKIITGGLSSGQPAYLNGVALPACSLLGLHSYNERLRGWPSAGYGFGDLESYIGAYQHVWSEMAGVALTEWGTTDDSDPFASEYIRHFLAVVREHPEVKLAAWFALSDSQSSTRHGLLRTDGTRKPQFTTYQKELSMPTFKLGFKDYADQHPKIGKPLTDETYFTPDTSVQIAEGGVLWYSKGANQVVCTPTGEPGK